MILSPRDTAPAFAVAPAYQLRPATSPRRISRVRVAWFVLGTLFGAGLSMGIAKISSHTSDVPASSSVVPATSTTSPVAAVTPEAPAAAPDANEMTPELTPGSAAISTPPEDAQVAAVAPAPEPEKPALQLPATVTVKVQKKDTFVSILMDNNVTHDEAFEAADSIKKLYNPKRIARGQTMELKLDHNEKDQTKASVVSLRIEESPLRTIELTQANGKFTAKEIKSPVYKGLSHAGGPIRSSLYQTAIDSGIPVKMVGEIIQAFSYDVDFQRDIKPGDRLDVVFERMHTEKNVTAGIGKMMYASLEMGDKTFTIYRHTSSDGFTGFYNAKGESVRKALLKTPINGAHVTSGFGMRMHPLLGYTKMHKGIDFGAPTGTPIYAAGDGTIEEAGRKGGYGNYVKLRHNKMYATAYGHASRIAKGIHPGVHVRQGQIIAYVGSTGSSTGPHLHYEIIAGNAPVNPSGVKFRTGQQLAGKEFLAFKKDVKQVGVVLASFPKKTQVASIK